LAAAQLRRGTLDGIPNGSWVFGKEIRRKGGKEIRRDLLIS
jgi:hypothetical protein